VGYSLVPEPPASITAFILIYYIIYLVFMLLKVENLNVFYKNKHILKDVSFDIEENEIFSIVGESGSGKSTIAKAIMGLIDYNGLIEYNGKDIFMIFQDPGNYLDPLFNIYSQIKMVKEAVKESSGMDIDKAINLVGLNVDELRKNIPISFQGVKSKG